jgi:hypothetical protein
MPAVLSWIVGVLMALVIGAALVYILGFIASMLVSMGYGLYEGVEHAVQKVHFPDVHLPHRRSHAAG